MWFIVAFACLISMNFTVRRSAGLSAGLLFGVGVALGLAMAPALVYYASTNPQALWQAGGATAIFLDALNVFLFFLRIFSREN